MYGMISSSSPTYVPAPSGRPYPADSILLLNIIIPAPWLCPRRHLTNKSIVSRVQTELESYPATLFNILADSPNWFTEAMTRRVRYHIWKIADLPKRLEEVIAIERLSRLLQQHNHHLQVMLEITSNSLFILLATTEDDEIADGERLPVVPQDYLTGSLYPFAMMESLLFTYCSGI